ncbi:MAG TPA: NAD-dependent epimerase [Flavobacteriales bacterium]|nr:NAD-dependent epimerase [Flavobacteriales bacterium]
MNKACVFGGSGFLGSHVADCLVEDGYSVKVFDRQPSAWLKDGQEMVVGNLLSLDDVNEAVAGADVVYNFAALSDLNEGLNKPLETIQINILGNAHVMEACRNHNVSRFIYASTVYVNSRDGGFYRCSKQAAEHYVEEYQRVFGLDFTILRYGSLYGPRADKANGLYRIVKNAVESGSVCYEGSSEALREYIHVTDAARASVVALGEEFCNQSVVLTGQEPMRVDDLLKMLAEILGYENGVEFLETNNIGHYVRTPYAYQPKLGRKYISPMHVDLGQGLIQLIHQIHTENSLGES